MRDLHEWINTKERVSWDYKTDGSEYGIVLVKMFGLEIFYLVHFGDPDDIICTVNKDRWEMMPRTSKLTRDGHCQVWKVQQNEALMIAFEGSDNPFECTD